LGFGARVAHFENPNLMENDTIARGLERIADLLALDGVPHERLFAHREAARKVEQCVQRIVDIVEEDGVEGLHALGIGYLLCGLIADWVRTGKLPLLEQLEGRHQPQSALQKVPGIGAGLARTLNAVGVDSLDALGAAAEDGRLSNVCGFGPRRVELVLGALATLMSRRGQRRPVQLTLGIDARAH
jgi:DNA polymerase (family 10)